MHLFVIYMLQVNVYLKWKEFLSNLMLLLITTHTQLNIIKFL